MSWHNWQDLLNVQNNECVFHNTESYVVYDDVRLLHVTAATEISSLSSYAMSSAHKSGGKRLTRNLHVTNPQCGQRFAPLSLIRPSLRTSVTTGDAAGRYLCSREYLEGKKHVSDHRVTITRSTSRTGQHGPPEIVSSASSWIPTKTKTKQEQGAQLASRSKGLVG